MQAEGLDRACPKGDSTGPEELTVDMAGDSVMSTRMSLAIIMKLPISMSSRDPRADSQLVTPGQVTAQSSRTAAVTEVARATSMIVKTSSTKASSKVPRAGSEFARENLKIACDSGTVTADLTLSAADQ